MAIKPKGLAEILEEDPSLKKRYTHQEYQEGKTAPQSSDISVEKAYEGYKAVIQQIK